MLRPLEQPKYSEHGDVARISLTSHRAFALLVPVSWRKRNPSQTAAPPGSTKVVIEICRPFQHFSGPNRNLPDKTAQTDRDIKFLCSGLELQQLSMVTPVISC